MFRVGFLLVAVILSIVQADQTTEKDTSYECFSTAFCKNNPKAPSAFFGNDVYCCKAGDSISLHAYSYYQSENYAGRAKRDAPENPSNDSVLVSDEAVITNASEANVTDDSSATSPNKATSYSNVTCLCNNFNDTDIAEAGKEMAKDFKDISNTIDDVSNRIDKTVEQVDQLMKVISGFPDIWDD